MDAGGAIGTASPVTAVLVDTSGDYDIAMLERSSLTIEGLVEANAYLGPRLIDWTVKKHPEEAIRPRLAGKQLAIISGTIA